jgi:hypothetical protein
MATLLGVIQNISTPTAMLDLFVYDDGIAVCRGASVKDLIRRLTGEMVGATLGGEAGFQSGVENANERDLTRAELSPDRGAVLAQHPKNRFVPLQSIAHASLKRRWDGSSKLELRLADGSRESFAWKKIYNDANAVRSILLEALGPRLTV